MTVPLEPTKQTVVTVEELIDLRDSFAAAALSGLIGSRTDGLEALARWAYQQADAMLTVRATLADPVVPTGQVERS